MQNSLYNSKFKIAQVSEVCKHLIFSLIGKIIYIYIYVDFNYLNMVSNRVEKIPFIPWTLSQLRVIDLYNTTRLANVDDVVIFVAFTVRCNGMA